MGDNIAKSDVGLVSRHHALSDTEAAATHNANDMPAIGPRLARYANTANRRITDVENGGETAAKTGAKVEKTERVRPKNPHAAGFRSLNHSVLLGLAFAVHFSKA